MRSCGIVGSHFLMEIEPTVSARWFQKHDKGCCPPRRIFTICGFFGWKPDKHGTNYRHSAPLKFSNFTENWQIYFHNLRIYFSSSAIRFVQRRAAFCVFFLSLYLRAYSKGIYEAETAKRFTEFGSIVGCREVAVQRILSDLVGQAERVRVSSIHKLPYSAGVWASGE